MPKKKRKNTIEDVNHRIEVRKAMIEEYRQKEERLKKEGNFAAAADVHKRLISEWKELSRWLQPKEQPLLIIAREMGYDVKPLVQLIIKMHLTADYLTDLIGRMQDEFDKMGASNCNFSVVLDAAFKQMQFLASMMAGDKNEALTQLIVDDEPLIECMDDLTDEYLKSRGMTPDCWVCSQEEYLKQRNHDKLEKNFANWQRKHEERIKKQSKVS